MLKHPIGKQDQAAVSYGGFNSFSFISNGSVQIQSHSAQDKFKKMGLSIAHYDMRFAKPLDNDLLQSIFRKFDKIITVEDGCLQGGFGSAILEFMGDHNLIANVVRLGIPD